MSYGRRRILEQEELCAVLEKGLEEWKRRKIRNQTFSRKPGYIEIIYTLLGAELLYVLNSIYH